MLKNKKIIGAVAIVSLLLPVLTFAQVTGITALGAPPITSLSQAQSSFENIVNWIIVIFWILTVLFLIWAAVLYLTAAGNEDKIKEARQRVIYALIAAAIALLSTGLQSIVFRLLSQGA
ncbi:MAG: hypothetical protein ABSE68_00780 [Minisyncoccia bacterium]